MLKKLFFGEEEKPMKERVRQWTRDLQKQQRNITRDMESTCIVLTLQQTS